MPGVGFDPADLGWYLVGVALPAGVLTAYTVGVPRGQSGASAPSRKSRPASTAGTGREK
ncbi:hypothetical protein ACWT_6756 [Actinoplanes sp. SE50]|nr:hypothetical protein ACPL_6887 [Actinoplanes sp. SE50/110]ATO86171.1 hypothetical protein ACWT_6756 [Actinoplanes sp. SE50]SLM03585.1 hypothetical protein ACSP50_6878 [Actinoplanes sp. SE50/110]